MKRARERQFELLTYHRQHHREPCRQKWDETGTSKSIQWESERERSSIVEFTMNWYASSGSWSRGGQCSDSITAKSVISQSHKSRQSTYVFYTFRSCPLSSFWWIFNLTKELGRKTTELSCSHGVSVITKWWMKLHWLLHWVDMNYELRGLYEETSDSRLKSNFFHLQFCWVCRCTGHCVNFLPVPAHQVANDKAPWDGNSTTAISDAVVERVFRWEMKSIMDC